MLEPERQEVLTGLSAVLQATKNPDHALRYRGVFFLKKLCWKIDLMAFNVKYVLGFVFVFFIDFP